MAARLKFIIDDLPLEALGRNRLLLSLRCPHCGHADQVDYYSGYFRYKVLGVCEKCMEMAELAADDLREAFLKRLKPELERAEREENRERLEELGRVIANAAILMRPVLPILIVGFWPEIMGHYIITTAIFLARLTQAMEKGAPRPLMFGMPPLPGTAANDYLTTLWGRIFLMSPAARIAYDILRRRPDQAATCNLMNFRTDHWGVASGLTGGPKIDPYTPLPLYLPGKIITGKLAPNCPPPKRANNLIDLRDHYWISDNPGDMERAPSPFTFTDDEHRQARQWLARQGLAAESFVCFLGRDLKYYAEKTFSRPIEVQKMSPEDLSFRNMDINTYLPAMMWLVDQGLAAIRTGSTAQQALDTERKGIVDYARMKREPLHQFLDLYLAANCRYYVSCGSGPDIAAMFAHRPLLFVNVVSIYIVLFYYNNHNFFLAFRGMWDNNKNRRLSFREIFERKLDDQATGETFTAEGISLIPQTGEEIRACVQEMEARATGNWTLSPEEEDLQEAFRAVLHEFYPGLKTGTRPLYCWLKRNRELLGCRR